MTESDRATEKVNKPEKFSDRLRALRDQMGWTQESLASRLGVTRSYLAQLESGQRQPGDTLALLLTALEGGAGEADGTIIREEPPTYKAHHGTELERAVMAEARLELVLSQLESVTSSVRVWCEQNRRRVSKQ